MTDLSLSKAILDFQSAIKKSKLCIMHKIFLPSRNSGENSTIFYDKKTNFMLFYESLQKSLENPKQNVSFKQSSKFKWKRIFDEGREFGMVTGLRDSQVAVCKGVVLNYFKDNFDHHLEREHFLSDLLSSEISDDQVSFGVADHQVFHEVPETTRDLLMSAMRLLKNCSANFSINKNRFKIRSRFRYISTQSQVLTCHSNLKSCFIGDYAKVGDESEIDHSVLQNHSKVGKSVSLKSSYLAEGVKVPDNWRLNNCYILKRNLKLDSETLTNYEIETKTNEQGGFDLNSVIIKENSQSCINPENFPILRDDESYDLDSESEEETELENLFENEFFEVMQSLEPDGTNWAKVNTDLKNLRFSHNKEFLDCLKQILQHAMFTLFRIQECKPEPPSYSMKLKKTAEPHVWTVAEFSKAVKGLQRYKEIFKTFISGPEEKFSVLNFCQEYAESFQDRGIQFHTLAQMFYGMELIQEDTFLLWEQNLKNKPDHSEFEKDVLGKMKKFMEWLRENDEEDESESESEDEDSDEDDDSETEDDDDDKNDSASDDDN